TSLAPPLQPGPSMCVNGKLVMVESAYAYPPPSGRELVSGLHCTMPNGTSAPGKVLPPLLVPSNGLTTEAGSATAALAAAVPVTAPSAAPASSAAEITARCRRGCDRDIFAPFGEKADNVVLGLRKIYTSACVNAMPQDWQTTRAPG